MTALKLATKAGEVGIASMIEVDPRAQGYAGRKRRTRN